MVQPTPALWAALPPVARTAVWMVLCGIFFSLMSMLIRIGSAELPATTMIVARNVLAFLCLTPILFRNGIQVVRAPRPFFLVWLGVIQVASNIGWFVALKVVPISDATAISFLTPVITPVLAIFFLGETSRPARFIALAVGFLGALIILRPGFQQISPEMLMLLGSAAIYAAFTLIIRSASRDHSSETIVFYTLIASQPLAVLLAIPELAWPSAWGWGMLFGIGVAAGFGQITATLGYSSGEISLVMPFDFLRLPIAAAISVAMVGEAPDLWTWVGGAVIFAAAWFVVRQETRQVSNKGEAA
ncbi:MAG: DMT family transporter [Alphaproteobacteria bacterium]|nr:DMT family transporter [Alphaproteobacteria bacterium]